MDLVFVVDSSNSLSSDDFERTKIFMQQVVDAFNISNDKTQVGVLTYSTAANINFYLNQYLSKSTLNSAIGNLPFKSGLNQYSTGH
uniref:VWFA domain-containing protein n=1 Tax=Pinctada fucata TaxID=50426 RepID=A0A194AL79_PINFU